MQPKNERQEQPAPRSPAELRRIFGDNLRQLSADYPSITEIARQLKINRTQFNRYLSGDSFPRPDVLARICDFFAVDARILLEPVEALSQVAPSTGAELLARFHGPEASEVPEEIFPTGFYRFARRSFINPDVYVTGLLLVKRAPGQTYLRGYETTAAMRTQDLPTHPQVRVFGAIVLAQENGVAIFAARRNSMTSSFNFLARVASFDNNFWVGYVTRTVREDDLGVRASRLVYEYLGTDCRRALAARRTAGFCAREDLHPFQRRLLRPDEPFA